MRTRPTISNLLAGAVAAAASLTALDAHAGWFTHDTGANQVAGSVHVPGNSNDIYVSTALGFKIRARFGLGSPRSRSTRAGMLRNAANYVIDTGALIAATHIQNGRECTPLGPGAGACITANWTASSIAWATAGGIYIGGPLLIGAALHHFFDIPIFA